MFEQTRKGYRAAIEKGTAFITVEAQAFNTQLLLYHYDSTAAGTTAIT